MRKTLAAALVAVSLLAGPSALAGPTVSTDGHLISKSTDGHRPLDGIDLD